MVPNALSTDISKINIGFIWIKAFEVLEMSTYESYSIDFMRFSTISGCLRCFITRFSNQYFIPTISETTTTQMEHTQWIQNKPKRTGLSIT